MKNKILVIMFTTTLFACTFLRKPNEVAMPKCYSNIIKKDSTKYYRKLIDIYYYGDSIGYGEYTSGVNEGGLLDLNSTNHDTLIYKSRFASNGIWEINRIEMDHTSDSMEIILESVAVHSDNPSQYDLIVELNSKLFRTKSFETIKIPKNPTDSCLNLKIYGAVRGRETLRFNKILPSETSFIWLECNRLFNPSFMQVNTEDMKVILKEGDQELLLFKDNSEIDTLYFNPEGLCQADFIYGFWRLKQKNTSNRKLRKANRKFD